MIRIKIYEYSPSMDTVDIVHLLSRMASINAVTSITRSDEWLKNEFKAVFGKEYKDGHYWYYEFENEEDAIMFKLKFNL